MKEYKIGSLSELITGSKTPNKIKVTKKKLAIKRNLIEKTSSQFDMVIDDSESKKKQKIKLTSKSADKEFIQTQNRKRKLTDKNNSAPKKSKNIENAERRVQSNSEEASKQQEDPESLARTVFVGNVPLISDTKKLKNFFTKYGEIETIRIRGIPVADPKMSKKVAMIKKAFHANRTSFHSYVRFTDREAAIKATEANGCLFQDHHLRIHLCDAEHKPDENKAIFVGNLSFHAEEENLWKIFEPCGAISSVRIVRDSKTGMGKGFGYVNFENSDSVTLALEMENVKLNERELRIKVCNITAAKKSVKGKSKKLKKPRKLKVKQEASEEGVSDMKNTHETKQSYGGIKFIPKKKNKVNKGLLQKKKKVKQIAPK